MEVGRVFVSVRPDFTGFRPQLDLYLREIAATKSLKIRAEVDTRQMRQHFDTIGRDATRSGSRIGSALGSTAALALRGTALAAGALAAGVVIVGKQAIDAGSKFDATMRQMAAIAGVPAKQLAGLRALALKMGADTVFSAQQAGEAMLELAKGGLSAAQIKTGALKATLTLAAAGSLDLASAATYMSNALNSFGLKAKDANAVAAAFAGGANASTASVESLGIALSQVGPGARTAGLSLQQTVAVLAAFDNAGIKGSDAGTSLKTALNNLVPQTKKAREAMRELGLDFLDAHGNILPITEIAQQLKDKLGQLSDAERIRALHTIFGSDATRAATVLMREGAAGIEKYIKATNDQSAAQTVANSRMSGMAGALEQMRGAVETAKIVLGTALAPAVIVVAKAIASAANTVSTQLIPALQVFSGGGGPRFAAMMGTLGAAVREAATAVGSVASPVLRNLANVITGQVVPAIQKVLPFVRDQLVAGFKSFTKAVQDNRPQLLQLGNAIVAVAGFIGTKIIPVLIQLYAVHLRTLITQIGASIRAIGFIVTAFGAWWRAMTTSVTNVRNFVTAAGEQFARLRTNASNQLASIIVAVSQMPGKAQAGFLRAAGGLVSAVASKFSEIRDKAKAPLNSLIDLINKFIGLVNKLPGVAFQPIGRLNGGGPVTESFGGGSFNRGGRIPGGGPNRDSVPTMLTPGEFVIQRPAVRALGEGLLARLNRAHELDLGGDRSGPVIGRRLNDPTRGLRLNSFLNQGGWVLNPLYRAAGGGIPTVQQWIRAQDPKPYIWGGTGPRGFDCSGITGAVFGMLTGRGGGNGQRYFTTSSDFGAAGFKQGTGTYTVGVNPGHHMAGNLGGLGFEARSTKTGIFVGGSARSVNSFAQQWYLPQTGNKFTAGGGGGGGLSGIARAALNTIVAPIRGGINRLGDGLVERIAKSIGNTGLDALIKTIEDKVGVFHNGGYVGSDQLAFLQQGEQVLSRAQVRSGGGGVVINVDARGAGDPGAVETAARRGAETALRAAYQSRRIGQRR